MSRWWYPDSKEEEYSREQEERERREQEYYLEQQKQEERYYEAEYVRAMCLKDGHRIHWTLGSGGPAVLECHCGEEQVQVLFG